MTKTCLCSFHSCPGCLCLLSDSHSQSRQCLLGHPQFSQQGWCWAGLGSGTWLRHCCSTVHSAPAHIPAKRKGSRLYSVPRNCYISKSVKAFQSTSFFKCELRLEFPMENKELPRVWMWEEEVSGLYLLWKARSHRGRDLGGLILAGIKVRGIIHENVIYNNI